MGERIKKVNEALKRELSWIILKEIDLPKGILVTLTKVETTKDLNNCKVFVSVIPENQTVKILKILSSRTYELHQKLNKILFIRRVPKIKFFEEKELPKAQKIDKILDGLDTIEKN